MKDIIEALEAKRAAARAGGMDKRSATPHATCRFVALILALTAACIAPLSRAQDVEPGWRSADGAFGVVIPPGWQTIDQFVSGPYLLAVGPPPGSATRENPQLPVCSVEGRPIATRQMAQDEINRLVESMLAPLTTQLRPSVVHSSGSELMNGVMVVSIDIDQQTPRGPTRQMQRMFAVPHASGIMHYQVGCGASGSAYSHADMAVLHGFLASLSLNLEAQTQ